MPASKKSLYPHVETMTDNILACYYAAPIDAKTMGRQWYGQARSLACSMAHAYNVPMSIVSAVFAVLSPMNIWTRNIKDANNLLKASISGVDYDDISVGTFPANKAKAINIIETHDIDAYLKGNKVNAFYRCILSGGHTDYVTIDGHAVSIALGYRETLDKIPTRYYGPVGYPLVSQAYINAMNAVNAGLEKNSIYELTAPQLQAITWIAHRKIHLNAYITDSASQSINEIMDSLRASQERATETLIDDNTNISEVSILA